MPSNIPAGDDPPIPAGENLAFAPIHTLAPLIASGRLAPRTLVECFLDRIERADAKLGAFVALYGEEALRAADAAGEAIAAGHSLGPLHGIPIALKDLIEIEGRVTTAGCLQWRDRVSTVTATLVRRLLGAGAVLLGKTHLVEFALGGWGTNYQMGTPWNPWDAETHRVPGGSSSGSGVAVAAGLASAALGSDTGGSVRIPSSFCGLVGLKTTHGRFSNYGVVLLCEGLDTVGPLTRSVEDAALLFDALHGPDGNDPHTLPHPRSDVLSGLKLGARSLRIGVVPRAELDASQAMEADIGAHYEQAAQVLEGLGAHLEEVSLGDSLLSLQAQTGILISAEAYQIHRPAIEDTGAPFDPWVQKRILAGKDVSGADYVEALKHQARARREMAARMRDFDAVILPTTPVTAQALEGLDEADLPHSRYTRAGNYLGLCALAVPMGFTVAGLPTSLQILGKPHAEDMALRIGWAYEQANPLLASHRPNLDAFQGGR